MPEPWKFQYARSDGRIIDCWAEKVGERFKCGYGKRVSTFTPNPSRLLEFLLDRPGQICSEHELNFAVWSDPNQPKGKLAVLASGIREKFGASDKDMLLVHIHGGYRFLETPDDLLQRGDLSIVEHSGKFPTTPSAILAPIYRALGVLFGNATTDTCSQRSEALDISGPLVLDPIKVIPTVDASICAPLGMPMRYDLMRLAVSANGMRVVALSDGKMWVWNVNGMPSSTAVVKHDRPTATLAVDGSGQQAITGQWDGTVALWDLRKPASPRAVARHPHADLYPNKAIQVGISADERSLVSCGAGSFTVWDRNLAAVRAKVMNDDLDDVTDLAISIDGKMCLTIGRSAIVWNLPNLTQKGLLSRICGWIPVPGAFRACDKGLFP